MKKLTELAIKRPLLIIVMFFVLIFFGLFSYRSLNYNLLPNMEFPIVTIVTTYRGASAQEIENNVTKHIEDGISSLEGISKINSSSMEGASIVTAQFTNGTNVDQALQDAQRRVNTVIPLLPTGIDAPVLNKFSPDDIPVLRMSVTANLNDQALFDLIDQQITPQLSNLKGVGQISLIGGDERQIKVQVDQKKLDFYGMSIAEVSNVIAAASLSTPAGKIQTLNNEFAIEFDSKFTDAGQLANLVVRQTPDGGKILLKDVASVYDGKEDPSTINHINGIPAIGVQVQKQTDANAVAVSALVKKQTQQLEKDYSDVGLKFHIASDQSVYTLKSANAVMEDLMLAIVIVSIVMLFFLHSLRNAFFVLVALPSSIIPTFIGMYLFGMSLNLMTLMALSLVVGILVDDSIVILENIMRHMEMGKNKRKATVDGRYEIGFTAIAITSVDLVVFLPMSMVTGLIGNIIREFSLTVVFSTFLSLVVCFTLTPLLTSRFGKLFDPNKKDAWTRMNKWFEARITAAKELYAQILKWALFHKKWVFIGTFALLVGSICLPIFGFIGGSFMAQGDQGEFVLKLELDPTATVYQSNDISRKAEDMILKHPEVVSVFTNVGFSEQGIQGTNSANLSQITVKLVDKEDRSQSDMAIATEMQKEISQIPGVKATVSPTSIIGGAERAPISLIVKGSNRDAVRKGAEMVMNVVEHTPGVIYPQFSTKNPKPEIKVELDREKMAMFGLNAATVGAALGTAFRGNDQAKYKYNGNEYDIMVESNDQDKTRVSDVKNLVFTNNQGQSFTLSQFASVKETMGESILERYNRLPSIQVDANVQGRPSGTVGTEITDKLDKMKFPAGVTYSTTGEMEDMGDAFTSLLAALGIGILLVYLIMVALYENAVYPFVVMMAMPLAVIGAFLALALTMNELTVFSMIGMIMLIGLVTKNGILLVDFANQRKAEGAGLVESLMDAGEERFRPVLMTTIAMILGMLPMALAKDAGAEVKNGMAWVLIGGLTSSLIMTLVVVPCFYYVIEKIQNRFRGRRRRKLVEKVKERRSSGLNPLTIGRN